MGSIGLILLRVAAPISLSPSNHHHHLLSFLSKPTNPAVKRIRNYSVKCSMDPPNLPHLANTARISLAPHEAEEFSPKIQQVVHWFGQLQAVDLQSIEPAIRADIQAGNFRDNLPETFENREAMIAAVPSYEEPYIKVPKVLNKD